MRKIITTLIAILTGTAFLAGAASAAVWHMPDVFPNLPLQLSALHTLVALDGQTATHSVTGTANPAYAFFLRGKLQGGTFLNADNYLWTAGGLRYFGFFFPAGGLTTYVWNAVAPHVALPEYIDDAVGWDSGTFTATFVTTTVDSNFNIVTDSTLQTSTWRILAFGEVIPATGEWVMHLEFTQTFPDLTTYGEVMRFTQTMLVQETGQLTGGLRTHETFTNGVGNGPVVYDHWALQ